MQNKWYVLGLLVPVLLLGWGAAHAAMTDGGLVLILLPAGLALALALAAFKVAKADAFAPKRQQRWDAGETPEVNRWLSDRADRPANVTTRDDGVKR